MTEQQRVTLSREDMAAIKAITSEPGLTPGTRLHSVLKLIWGEAWYDRQSSIDPTMFALSSAQWQEVCGYLTSGVETTDRMAGVNLGLEWMNRGPSAYDH